MNDSLDPPPTRDPEAATAVAARYFDGRQALAHEVSLSMADGRVFVRGNEIDRSEPIAAVEISSRIGRTPRFVRFHGDAYCEVVDHEGFDALLATTGVTDTNLSRWEQSGRLAAVLLVVLAGLAVIGYRYGLPRAAEIAARRLPPAVLDIVSRQTLGLLDRSIFDATNLPETRQRQLQARFQALTHPASPIPLKLEFRGGGALGANAMALPNGTIVVTDGLVALATRDEEIMAVLAHEAGHVEERHGLRNVIQSSVLSVFVSWYLGDVNAIVAAAPTVLMQAKYSRDLEREADDYAARFLTANGLDASLLATMLEKLERERREDAGPASSGYLSSHPTTRERIERLRSSSP